MKPSKQSLRKKKKYKFEIGDYLRISHTKRAFSKECDQRWTWEPTPCMIMQEEGTFYEEELKKVIPNEFYRVEKVLKRRHRCGHPKEVLVRWLNWPSKYNSWIPESHLRDYKSLVA